jgi:hypothetical protein
LIVAVEPMTETFAKAINRFASDRGIDVVQGSPVLRTETTTNDTRDVAIGRRLLNLAGLRPVGATAN